MSSAFYLDLHFEIADLVECYVIFDPVWSADLNYHCLQNLKVKGKSLKVKDQNLKVKNQNLGVKDKKTTVY